MSPLTPKQRALRKDAAFFGIAASQWIGWGNYEVAVKYATDAAHLAFVAHPELHDCARRSIETLQARMARVRSIKPLQPRMVRVRAVAASHKPHERSVHSDPTWVKDRVFAKRLTLDHFINEPITYPVQLPHDVSVALGIVDQSEEDQLLCILEFEGYLHEDDDPYLP